MVLNVSDGGGLFIQVSPQGSKLWRMAYRFTGLQKLLSFGAYPAVGLAAARHKREDAKKLQKRQAETINERTRKPFAKATIKSRFDALQAFWNWLADQSVYRSKIKHSDSDYFNLSANDSRIATTKREKPVPALADVHRVIESMKADAPFEKRARAIVAFTLLTAARDDAIASLSLKHIDLQNRFVMMDARQVRTKFRKTFKTTFYQVGGKAEAIVVEWVQFLKTELAFDADNPLFPSTLMRLEQNGSFTPSGFKREHWKNADAIRSIFKDVFAEAGMPYFNAHSVRSTIARLSERVCNT